MSVGKYSPTVYSSYRLDQNWWSRNGGGFGNGKNPDSDLDDDGYDSYGYSHEDGCGPDRAGHTEEDYLTCGESYVDSNDEDQYHYPLYEDVYSDWAGRLLGDLPNFKVVKYNRIYIEYVKFEGVRYFFHGSTLYIHEEDMDAFMAANIKYVGA